MYNVRKMGYVIREIAIKPLTQKALRISYESKLWKIWRAVITPGTCYYCASMNGRILAVDDPCIFEIPVHPNCKCYVEALTAIAAGTATNAGADGVDLYVAIYGKLPDCYISSEDAKELGWEKLRGNLAEVLPGKLIGGDVFENRKHKLPELPGRIWYEADFDYTAGYRNNCRLLYSSDGLLFVTYDHYMSFYEIELEGQR